MQSYTTSVEFANANAWMPADFAEERYGAHAAKTGRVAKHGTSWSIFEDNAYRQASPLEIGGIESELLAQAVALSHFAGYDLDEAALLIQADLTADDLADAGDWFTAVLAREADAADYLDTVSAARYGIQMF